MTVDRSPSSAAGSFLLKAFFALTATPVVLRASLRAAWWLRRLPLDEAVERLRRVNTAGPWLRHRPRWLAALLDRMLPVLPPWGHGACMKRSLCLLDLWARCGLEPRVHLGMRRTDGAANRPGTDPATTSDVDLRAVDLHAWVTAGPLSTPAEHDEFWSL